MNVETLASSNSSAWDSYVNRHVDGTLYHLTAWARVLESAFNHRAHYLCAMDSREEIAGVLPLCSVKSHFSGHGLVSVPVASYGGVLSNSSEAAAQLIQAAKTLRLRMGAAYVELRHLVPLQQPTLFTKQSKATFRLTLPRTEGEMWKTIGSKCRNLIRKAERSGLVARYSADDVRAFYDVYARNMRDVGVPVFPKRLFECIAKEFAAHTTIMIVEYDGHPVGVACLLSYKGVLEVPFASSLREYFSYSPNMLLYWEAIRFAIATGHREFDFGRSSIGSSAAQFKRQWGASTIPLYYQYICADGGTIPAFGTSNPKFARLVSLWKRLPIPVANWLGPMVQRRIPS